MKVDGRRNNQGVAQGLDEFTFTLNDARRNPLTGEFAEEDVEQLEAEEAAQEADEVAADSGNEDDDREVFSDNDGTKSSEGGYSTDPNEGPDNQVEEGMTLIEQANAPSDLEGVKIAHRFDTGWYMGKVLRKGTCSINTSENGRYAAKYPDSRKEYFHDLYPDDYGCSKMWVVVVFTPTNLT